MTAKKEIQRTAYVRDIYKPIKSFPQSVFWRFASLWLLVSIFYFTYNTHPYYLNPDYAHARELMRFTYTAFCFLVLPYTWFTLKFNYRLKDDFKDPSIIFFVLLKRIGLMVATRDYKQVHNLFKLKRFNNFCLTCMVKGFFLPVMMMFIYHHWNTIQQLMYRISTPMDGITLANWFVDLIYNSIFMVDIGTALIGYGLELKWLNNKTRAVEYTWLGWISALMCYPPFNNTSSIYFPIRQTPEYFIELTPEQALVVRIIITFLYCIFVWATVALGVRFSNLSNKGIVDRGPYKYIRHPAYISKNLAWWFEYLQYMKGFRNVLALLCWNVIYTVRALTEERNLLRDPDYREYKKRVKWFYIPGLI